MDNVVVLFEKQVMRSPNAKALSCQEWWLTYKELDQLSNSVANYILGLGYQKNSIIGIMVPRTLEMVIDILGILKAGMAYLPIDPAYPANRIDYILEDSGAELLICEDYQSEKASQHCKVVDMDQLQFIHNDSTKVEITIQEDDLAYVIYTSGTTGSPKGVMVEHKSVSNFIFGMCEIIDFKQGANIINLTTIAFDIFFVETLLPLTRGMHVIIADENAQMNPNAIKNLITAHQINTMQITPSRLKLIFTEINADIFEQIEILMVGGEQFPESLLTELNKYKRLRIYNMYGPTETTIWSTVKELTGQNKVSIGKPLLNMTAFLLNEDGQVVKDHEIGELSLSGPGVALGYLNQENLTNKRFISDTDFERYYRTGDLARYNKNGDLECLGRIDNQVKIRGYRVELEEIEKHIMDSTVVKDCIVCVKNKENGMDYLVAIVVYIADGDCDTIVEYLRKNLSEYAIPAEFIAVEQLSYTQNGKVDRGKLKQLYLQ